MDELEDAPPPAEAPTAASPKPRPRFEMRMDFRKTQKEKASLVGKLGLSTAQGAVEGIKLYAASHAAKEENYRHVTELAQVLKSGERDKARKDFVDATRAKVLSAAQRHVEEKKRKEDLERGAPSGGASAAAAASAAKPEPSGITRQNSATPSSLRLAVAALTSSPAPPPVETGGAAVAEAPTSSLLTPGGRIGQLRAFAKADLSEVNEAIDELTRRRRALVQTGFDTEANEVGNQLNRLREVADGKRREAEQKLYKQRLWALQLSQKSELNKMNRELEAKKVAAEARWKEEVDALNAKQAAEYQKKVESITKAAALEEVELPKRLIKYRYRPSPQLQALKETSRNLKETGGLKEMIDAVQIKYTALEEEEVTEWRDNFLRVALGSDVSSYISQLLSNQQVTWDKTMDRMRKEQHAFEMQQAQEGRAQEAQFRIARWKLQNDCKKQAAEKEERERMLNAQRAIGMHVDGDEKKGAQDDGADVEGLLGMDDSFHEARAGDGDAEASLPWGYSDALSAWMWVNELDRVFEALTSLAGYDCLEPLRRHVERMGSDETYSWLDWLLRIAEVELMGGSAREKATAAAELYELMNDSVLPSGFDVDVVLAELRISAAAFRSGLLSPAFTSFLGTPCCSRLMRNVDAIAIASSEEADGLASVPGAAMAAAVPIVDVSRGFAESFTSVAEKFPQAVCLVDAKEGGLPMMYVNAAWEKLTGYPRAEAVGRNCRLLQGESTEESAIAQIVQALRERKACTVCISNYRKDGSRFRNALTLHPVCDSEGAFRYAIGLATNVDASQDHSAVLDAVHALLPRSFPASLSQRPAVALLDKRAQDRQYVQAMLARTRQSLLQAGEQGVLRCLSTDISAFVAFVDSLEPAERETLCQQEEGFSEEWIERLRAQHNLRRQSRSSAPSLLDQATPAPSDTPGGGDEIEVQVRPRRMSMMSRISDNISSANEKLTLKLSSAAAATIDSMPRRPFELFLESIDGQRVVESLVPGVPSEPIAAMMGGEYEPPTDASGFLKAFVSIAAQFVQYDAMVTLSDMTQSGNPLVFVNDAFCATTGYAREEVLGISCRFLQGPRTTPESVDATVVSSRTGTDCCVKLVNYRKDGTTFEQLLLLRPVHDSNRVYRFCIGVGIHTSEAEDARKRAGIAALLGVIPTVLKTWSPNSSELRLKGSQGGRGAPVGGARIEKVSKPEAEVKMIKESLDAHFLLLSLPEAARDAIADCLGPVSYQAGGHIIRQGDVADTWFVLAQGLCSVHIAEAGDKAVAMLTPGNIFGEIGVLQAQPRNATIMAETDVVCYAITSEQYFTIAAMHDERLRPSASADDAADENPGAPAIDELRESFRVPRRPDGTSAAASVLTAADGSPPTQTQRLSMVVSALNTLMEETLAATGPPQPEVEDEAAAGSKESTPSKQRRPSAMRPLSSFASNHSKMRSTLLEGRAVRQLSMLSWMGEPAATLAHLVTIDAARRALCSFASSHWTPPRQNNTLQPSAALFGQGGASSGNSAAGAQVAQQLAAIHRASLPSRNAAILLGQLAPWVNASSLTSVQVEEKLDEVAHSILHTLALSLLPQFLPSAECSRMVQALPVTSPGAISLKGAARRKTAGGKTAAASQPLLLRQDSWPKMLETAVEHLPVAVSLVDAQVAGLPMMYVNAAWEKLTGYPRAEAVGRNCRLLQGESTEESAIAQIVQALRERKACTVCISNYRKEGSEAAEEMGPCFRNALTLHPVCDSEGAFRYVIGLASDADASDVTDALSTVRKLLPDKLPATLDKDRSARSPSSFLADIPQAPQSSSLRRQSSSLRRQPTGGTNRHHQYKLTVNHLVRATSMLDKEEALWQITQHDKACSAFSHRLHDADSRHRLELMLEVSEVEVLYGDEQHAAARELHGKHLSSAESRDTDAVLAGGAGGGCDELVETLSAASTEAMRRLAQDVLPRAMEGDLSKFTAEQQRLMDHLLLPLTESLEPGDLRLLWPGFTPPPEVHGLLSAMLAFAAPLPFGVSLSDMTLSGNPLVYVNDAFCATTGYAREEVLGHNCRFLQGPRTAPESVDAIVSAMRSGTDCCVKLVNYRKDGTTFEQLLLLRPLHDSNHVYRLCVALQLEINEAVSLSRSLASAEYMFKFMPSKIDYCTSSHLQPLIRLEVDEQPSAGQQRQLELATEQRLSRIHVALFPEADVAPIPPVELSEADLYTRVQWSRKADVRLVAALLTLPDSTAAFSRHLRAVYKMNLPTFAASAIEVFQQQSSGAARQRQAAVGLLRRFYPEGPPAGLAGADDPLRALDGLLRDVLQQLLEHMPKFAVSNEAAALMQALRSRASSMEPGLSHALRLRLPENALGSEGMHPDDARARRRFTDAQPWAALVAAATMDDAVAVSVADAQLPGLPLVHVNRAFETLTGYRAAEALGRNCRFLQESSQGHVSQQPEVVEKMVKALREAKACEVTLTNYRRDGTPFTNLVSFKPVIDTASGRMRFVVATARQQSIGFLNAAHQHDDNVALLHAVPSTIRCSTDAPHMPAPTRIYTAGAQAASRPGAGLGAPAAAEAGGGSEGDESSQRGSEADDNDDADDEVERLTESGSSDKGPPTATTAMAAEGAWVGAPVRHHVAALRTLLRLPASACCGGISGAEMVLNFLREHWKSSGRVGAEGDGRHDGQQVELDVQLSLHSKNLMRNALEHVRSVLELDREVGSLYTQGARAVSGEDRTMKIVDLYTNWVKTERARGGRPRKMQRAGQVALLAAKKAAAAAGNGDPLSVFAAAASIKLSQAQQANSALARALAASGEGGGSTDAGSEAGAPSTAGGERSADERSEAGSIGAFSLQSSRMPSGRNSPTGSESGMSDGGKSEGGMSAMSAGQLSAGHQSGGKSETGETMQDAVESHLSMLHHLMVFDAWTDLLASPRGAALRSSLAASSLEAEQRLGRLVEQCARSLPHDTDSWCRLFISSVAELDQVSVIVCDASLPACPILSVNVGFEIMSGYSAEDAVGQSCRFLQGAKTDEGSIATVRAAVQTATPAHVKLINYRKDGTVFLNMLSLRPVVDAAGGFRFMIGISVEVSDAFSQMKPRLMQMDRLLKLLPEAVALPSPAEVGARIELTADAILDARRHAEEQALAAAQAARERLHTEIDETGSESGPSPRTSFRKPGNTPQAARAGALAGSGHVQRGPAPTPHTPRKPRAKGDASAEAPEAAAAREKRQKALTVETPEALAKKAKAVAAQAAAAMRLKQSSAKMMKPTPPQEASPSRSAPPRLLQQRPASARTYVSPATAAARAGPPAAELPSLSPASARGSSASTTPDGAKMRQGSSSVPAKAGRKGNVSAKAIQQQKFAEQQQFVYATNADLDGGSAPQPIRRSAADAPLLEGFPVDQQSAELDAEVQKMLHIAMRPTPETGMLFMPVGEKAEAGYAPPVPVPFDAPGAFAASAVSGPPLPGLPFASGLTNAWE